MMDVTFVLEESGVTATVEVPCEADVAAAKEVACTALAVSPASVEMRIGTQVLEGTCRLQDTAFDAGVQVVLARPRFADIKCPAEYSAEVPTDVKRANIINVSLSPYGALCLFSQKEGYYVTGFDTETFSPAFTFKVDVRVWGTPAISRCRTRCYLPCSKRGLFEVALPGGEVLRKVDPSSAVVACGGVVISKGYGGVSVYDEDLTLLRSLAHKGCGSVAVSDCGGWVVTSSLGEEARLWDVNTGEAVACVPVGWQHGVALSRSASVFAAVGEDDTVHLYDWSGAALRSVDVDGHTGRMQFTPCGKYLVVKVAVTRDDDERHTQLHQYDVVTMSCVHVIPQTYGGSFAISPCSRVVVFGCENESIDPTSGIVTRHLYPYNSE